MGIPWQGRSTTQNFQSGYVKDCLIEDLKGVGSGLPTLSSQAFWHKITGVQQNTPALVYHEGNVIRRIMGGEGEGIYWNDYTWQSGTKSQDNEFRFEMQNDSIYDCEDRGMNIVGSTVTINNSYFRTMNPSIIPETVGSCINVFTLNNFANPSHRVTDIVLTNNTFINPYDANGTLLSIGDAKDVTITNNLFSKAASGNIGGLQFGSPNTTGGLGAVENANISGNTHMNAHVQFLDTFTPSNFVMDGDTFNMNHTIGGGNGAAIFRKDYDAYNGGAIVNGINGFTVRNLDINVNISGANFNGLLNTGWTFINTTWENITLDYASPYSTVNGEFGRFYNGANFDSSNNINGVIMTNASGTGSLVVDGTGTVRINGSTGDGNPITVQ